MPCVSQSRPGRLLRANPYLSIESRVRSHCAVNSVAMLLSYHVRRCTTLVSTHIIHKDFDLFEYLPVQSTETYSVSSVSLFSVDTNRDLGAKLLWISLRRSMTIGMWQKRKKCLCSARHSVARLVKALCYNPEGRVFEIFHWFSPFGRTITFGSAQLLTEMSTIQYPLGAQAITFMCRLSRNSGSLNLLEPERPVQALLGDNFMYVLPFGPKELTHTHTHTHTRARARKYTMLMWLYLLSGTLHSYRPFNVIQCQILT